MDEYPKPLKLMAHVCVACVAREGSECHTPGCLFWLCDVAELPPRLDMYVDSEEPS